MMERFFLIWSLIFNILLCCFALYINKHWYKIMTRMNDDWKNHCDRINKEWKKQCDRINNEWEKRFEKSREECEDNDVK